MDSKPGFDNKAFTKIVFIGHYWMYEAEARALRDWLNQVIP